VNNHPRRETLSRLLDHTSNRRRSRVFDGISAQLVRAGRAFGGLSHGAGVAASGFGCPISAWVTPREASGSG